MINLADELIRWIQHSHLEAGRSPDELSRFDKLWLNLTQEIRRIESCEAPMDYEADFARMAQHSGTLYRVHQDFDLQEPFGVRETASYVSWTKQPRFHRFSWLENQKQVLLIKAHVTFPEFGIDLIGIKDWANKYDYPLSLGSHEIEQEVVYPLLFDTIIETKVIDL
ncbi:hypothetical protein NRIC_16150 [Enterococcus florum]|uniref:Uncharacterized protein n=1 Tax=Enterococcus florum TaxID=2480627 RepID=A0A4P5PB83_9ENTE|nr:hypothetical protein [Enterococcus florum]GCF93724.1 hypothetical protein NRIC_16150 [Enterococcus florum]